MAMAREIVELEIAPDGEIMVQVQGMLGPRCLGVRDLLRELLGPIRATAFTEEFYAKQLALRLRNVG